MRLSIKVISIYLASVLSALTIMSVIGINLSIRQATSHITDAADIALRALAGAISEDLGLAFAQIDEIAKSPDISSYFTAPKTDNRGPRLRVAPFLKPYIHLNPDYLHVYVGLDNGTLLNSSLIALPKWYDPRERPWYTIAIKHRGGPAITNIYKSVPSKNAMASISRAVEFGGIIRGVVGIDFLFSRYQTMMQDLAFQSGFMIITHNNASLFAHSQRPELEFTALKQPENKSLKKANQAQNGERVIIDGQAYTAYTHTLAQFKIKIITFVSEATLQKTRFNYISLYLATAAVLLAIVGFSGARLAKKALLVEQNSIKAKNDFFKNMSHEIRTPLNAVVGFVDLLGDSELSSKQKSWVRHTRTAASHLAGLVNDVLDLSSIRAGKYRISQKPYAFHDLMPMWSPLCARTSETKRWSFIPPSPR